MRMGDAAITARMRAQGADEAAALVRDVCTPLPEPEKADAFGAEFDHFGEARIVLLGEATHGTSEFYNARAAITQRLISQHGFNIVAVEADWPDAARIDRYVRDRGVAAGQGEEEPFARFPTWMWRNQEVAQFTHWLRAHNEHLSPEHRVEFRGLDVYSLRASIAAVLAYLDRADPSLAARARRRYGCLSPWQDEPARYGRHILGGDGDTCEEAVVAQLREMLEQRSAHALHNHEDWFDAAQNARIVRAAEQYYRVMYEGGASSWNLRDRHMFDTLKYVLDARGPQGKAVVWAHNSHIGDASATAMGWQGEFNIGELCRKGFGKDAVLIGFGTDRGTVAAADDWGAAMQVKQVRPAREDSYERVFRQSGVARSLTDLRIHDDLCEALTRPRLERAIGVVYRPDTEFLSHYFEAVLSEQFDAFVWFEETRAVTPLRGGPPHGAPDTYPFGL